MMKKSLIFLVSLTLFTLAGCNNTDFSAGVSEDIVKKITVGSTINFANYLTYDNDVDLKITYSTNKVKDKEYQSVYFLTSEVSMHDFVFVFSKNGKTKTFSCSIDVVAKAPTVQESTNAVFVNKGETVTFDDLFNASGIDAMPFGYVNIDFTGVTYTPNYSYEYVNFDQKQDFVYKKIDKDIKEYTFDKFGKYIFDLDVNNSEGYVLTNLQVSVLDNSGEVIQGMSGKGMISGKDNLVQLVRSNSMSNLSYLFFENSLKLNENNEYTIKCDFVGKEAPQLMLLGDNINGKKYSGKGFIISLEEDNKNQLGIYGYNRLNSANQSPKRSDGNTFSRKFLLDDLHYSWELTFRKTLQNDGSYKLAIKSNLYKENELYRVYSWVSFEVENFDEPSYFGYLGSSLNDIVFRYYPIDIKEVRI